RILLLVIEFQSDPGTGQHVVFRKIFASVAIQSQRGNLLGVRGAEGIEPLNGERDGLVYARTATGWAMRTGDSDTIRHGELVRLSKKHTANVRVYPRGNAKAGFNQLLRIGRSREIRPSTVHPALSNSVQLLTSQ